MSGWLLPILQDRVRMLQALQRKVPRKVPGGKRRWLLPWALEKRYTRLIHSYLLRFIGVLDLSAYPEWLKSYHGDAENFSSGWARNLQALRAAQKQMFDDLEGDNFYGLIGGLGEDVSTFNMNQWRKILEGMIGHDFYPPDYPGVMETLQTWQDRNFELIKSLSDTYIQQVNTIVSEGIRAGTTYRDLMIKIKALDHRITVSRAKLIARDQVGKLNGELAQRRQVDAGVETYQWQTAGDERVRGNPLGKFPKAIPSHWLMDGKVCRWDDPSVYKVGSAWVPRTGKMSPTHPSREIQCRCIGLPIMEDLWQDAIKG